LTTKTDPRRLLVFGLILGSITMFDLSGLNLYAGFWDICWVQVVQGVALSFLFIPLMTLAMARIPTEKMGNATSIFNLMRNIGGSVGIAIMTTFLARRSQLHQNHLIEKITPANGLTLAYLHGLQAHFHDLGADKVTAARKALGAMYGMVQQQAAMLAFVEAFWIMGAVFLLMLPFLPLLQYSKRPPSAKSVSRPDQEMLTRIELPARADASKPGSVASDQPVPAQEVQDEEFHFTPH
jgi:DHA2 family multidrug resistance protein